MSTILHARRESTKAAEMAVPAGEPWQDWTDADFRAYEARLAAERAESDVPDLLDSDLELFEPDPDVAPF